MSWLQKTAHGATAIVRAAHSAARRPKRRAVTAPVTTTAAQAAEQRQQRDAENVAPQPQGRRIEILDHRRVDETHGRFVSRQGHSPAVDPAHGRVERKGLIAPKAGRVQAAQTQREAKQQDGREEKSVEGFAVK